MKFTGLTSAEAEASRLKYGANTIPEPAWTTFGQAFMETFRDPMIRILLVMVALMIAMYFAGHAEIYEPVGTIVTVIIVATVTARTNVASDTEYRALRARTAKDTAKVCRDGGLVVLPVDEIVVGDHVILQGGNKIPADGMLVAGELRVNNTALNGETEECPKTPADSHYVFPAEITGDTFVDDATLFRGSVVFDGEGVMEVRRVGMQTMMGRMTAEMQAREPDSPLQVKLAKLADQISAFGYLSGLVIISLYMMFFALRAGGLEAYVMLGWSQILVDLIQAVSLAILIIVCAVPEGLPLMISLVLMQNTSRMLARGVLVRRAVGIETAGSLNILFSDKTGTITGGQLEVVDFFTADGKVLGTLTEHPVLHEKLKLAIGMNSAAMYDEAGAVVGGNPTDQAVMRFLGAETYRVMQTNENYRVGHRQTFNSTNKFSQAELPARGTVVYKGAPEALLARAKYALAPDGAIVPFDADALNEKINAYAARAMRVLAFGYSEQPFQKNAVNTDVVLIGFAAIRDDVRPEAREAITEVQAAGVQVVMVTGDRRETAVAIARDAGLLRADSDLVLTSNDLAQMTDEEVQRVLPQLRVIARALPTDKSRIVRLSQKMNLVVGMTGDGVNDSPALRRADVGFAMGSGTEAARDAGDIVILDDNFRSIKDAILYGRTIYNNILKFCRFQLVINIAAVVVSAIAPFFGIIEPLRVTHLLFINLVMDSLGAIMLGNEPAHESYMREKPRRRDASIISPTMSVQIVCMGTWLVLISFFFLTDARIAACFDGKAEHYTAYFLLFVLASLMNGFNVRSTGFGIFRGLGENIGFVRVWAMIVLIMAAIINAPYLPHDVGLWIGGMFSTTPIHAGGWVLVFLLAATMIPADLLRKAVWKGIVWGRT
ncbi:calcium-translocating P-type ATPase, PMCA-type [Selenomonas sp. oral taxon 920]|uniref:calcium-translocating P-type ATPase, PMCA-type n=1 Tax=Selenomonas sp. oral taxon 920 TaxID=1884263 RepID=UPI000840F884|nr:calcium-translocating P-type ATPase, PMCA-type [Selenomonas sp. oral taxon 920]AOH48728.1 calcium-translocating P-type ATPase, PMCA-type [Selenomonas sp. oral taxon 920]